MTQKHLEAEHRLVSSAGVGSVRTEPSSGVEAACGLLNDVGGLSLEQGAGLGGNNREGRQNKEEEPIIKGLMVEVVEVEDIIAEEEIKGGQGGGTRDTENRRGG